MPNTLFLLDVRQTDVTAELKLPVPEFEAAIARTVLSADSADIAPDIRAMLPGYVTAHLLLQTPDGKAWHERIGDVTLSRTEQEGTGPYREITVFLTLTPPARASPRRFALHWDGIIHQVVTHKALVSLRRDWGGGKTDALAADAGIIALDPRDNSVPPMGVDLGESSVWRGLASMAELGIHHISEGTDHLLFLLVLLLPAPLLARSGGWKDAVGTRRAVGRLLDITLAFTLGHSLTLLAGTLGWLRLPSQPVELAIALSILIGAVHVLRPIFPGKEGWVAVGFGLVHGLAFADILRSMNLEGEQLAISLLGFNLGIEAAQLFVVLLVMPWLILLSQDRWYSVVRIVGASVAAIAALAWMLERITARPNRVTALVAEAGTHTKWMVLALAFLALVSYARHHSTRSPS